MQIVQTENTHRKRSSTRLNYLRNRPCWNTQKHLSCIYNLFFLYITYTLIKMYSRAAWCLWLSLISLFGLDSRSERFCRGDSDTSRCLADCSPPPLLEKKLFCWPDVQPWPQGGDSLECWGYRWYVGACVVFISPPRVTVASIYSLHQQLQLDVWNVASVISLTLTSLITLDCRHGFVSVFIELIWKKEKKITGLFMSG